jgi:NTE family protein
MKREKKLIVILSGGGAKSAFQTGAWSYIQKHSINLSGTKVKIDIPSAVFGVSGGGLNGAMIAMGKHQELFDMWDQIAGNPSEVYNSDFVKQVGNKVDFDTNKIIKHLFSDLNTLQKAGLMFKHSRKRSLSKVVAKLKEMDALADYTPLFEKIKKLISIEAVKSDVFKAGFVSLTDGNYYAPSHFEYKSDIDFQNGIMASADIPVFWSPIEQISTQNFTSTKLVDGGIRNVTPFGDAVKYINNSSDADYHFLVISTHTGKIEKMTTKPNLLSITKRTLKGVLSSEMQDNDLNEFLRVNTLVKQAELKGIELIGENGQKLKSFKFKMIRPSRELGFALDFSRTSVLDSFSQGFQQARKEFESLEWE